MRIAYVVGTFPCLSETFIVREMAALERKGHELTILALRRPRAGPVHADAAPFLERVRCRSRHGLLRTLPRHARCFARSPGPYLRALASVLARLPFAPVRAARKLSAFCAAVEFVQHAREQNVEHVHAHFLFVPAEVARWLGRLLDVPFSVSAHAWDLYARDPRAYAGAARTAAFLAACTARGRDALRAAFPEIPPERVVLIRHGLEPVRFRTGDAAGNLVLAAGRIVEKKGFVDLVDACALLRDRRVSFRCVIAGDGAQRGALADRIRGARLSAHVTLTGALSQKELAGLFRQAALFVAPSVTARDGDRDGLPNVILEAMAAGLPVIATDACAAGEAVADGQEGFLVPAGQAQPLADSVEALLANAGLRAAMGRRGRARIEREFDMDRNIEPLIRQFDACRRVGDR